MEHVQRCGVSPRFGRSLSAAVVLLTPLFAQSGVDEILRQHVHVTERDLTSRIRKGAAFAKVLPAGQKGEVAAAGVVRMGVGIDFFLQAFRAIETFKTGPAVLRIHRFGGPLQRSDLDLLGLERKEARALPKCRPGHCGIKASAGMMERFRQDLGHLRGDRTAAAEDLFRSLLFQYVDAYEREGNPAMITYQDKLPPVDAAAEFQRLAGQFGWLAAFDPVVSGCLARSVAGPCPEIESFLYWSREKLGAKPVLSVTHVLIFRTGAQGRKWAFIASKQVYANHYFEASLGLTVLVEESPGASLWVIYFNRSRIDALKGWLGSFKRAIVENRIPSGVRKNLDRMRERLEGQYRSAK